jgi:hypothetical protein
MSLPGDGLQERSPSMPLLKDLISIPERVHQGDFVLQLSKGVTEPEQTLRDYV